MFCYELGDWSDSPKKVEGAQEKRHCDNKIKDGGHPNQTARPKDVRQIPFQPWTALINHLEIDMSKPETITIDDVKYIRADSVEKCDGDIKIVIADRGFVYIGNVEETDDFVKLKNSSNIRVWGTTKGIGELVGGPLSGTKLDKVGSLRIPNRAVISIIDVEQAKWKLL
jgi:hypothetical protein